MLLFHVGREGHLAESDAEAGVLEGTELGGSVFQDGGWWLVGIRGGRGRARAVAVGALGGGFDVGGA